MIRVLVILLAALVTGVYPALGQASKRSVDKFSIGLSAGHFYVDPGISVTVTSPFFANNSIAVRCAMGLRWMNDYQDQLDLLYSTAQTGIVWKIYSEQRTRLYAETAVTSLFPLLLSDQSKYFGASTSVGFDFFVVLEEKWAIAYFFEGGMTWLQKRGHEQKYPIVANGFTPVTGFRVHF